MSNSSFMAFNISIMESTILENESTNNTFSMDTAIETFAFNMETVYLWIILIAGVPGNCATIITVMKMSPEKSLTVYIALLAIVDNLAIISKLLIFVLVDNLVHIGPTGCKILGYFGNYLSTFANWLLVALSIERFVAVWQPVKLAQKWTFRKTSMAVSLIAAILSLTFLHLFWTVAFVNDVEGEAVYCSAEKEYVYFMTHVWYWVNVVLYATLPCLLLTIFNLLIVQGIVRSRRETYLKDEQCVNVSSSSERQRQVTLMLVVAAFTLVVLTTPRCVILILTPHYDPPAGTREGSVYYLLDTIAFVLCDLTHAVNFYIYSLSAKSFRKQFVDLILCRRDKRRRRTYQMKLLSSRPLDNATSLWL